MWLTKPKNKISNPSKKKFWGFQDACNVYGSTIQGYLIKQIYHGKFQLTIIGLVFILFKFGEGLILLEDM